MFAPLFLLPLAVVVAAVEGDDEGFGGATAGSSSDGGISDGSDGDNGDNGDNGAFDRAVASVKSGEFTGGGSATWTSPSTSSKPGQPPKTPLELELERAHIDPAQHPLVQLRVDVARLQMELADFEGRGLTAARATEEKLAAAKALLVDAERIGLHRLRVCQTRLGQRVEVKNYRMTAAGAVPLTTAELMGQAQVLDPPGCARIDLVDQAVVDRLRRAHDIELTLQTVNFPYHRVAERRALEDELAALKRELAKEDLPILAAPGVVDPYGH